LFQDAVGQSGGIWLLWRSGLGDITIIEASDQFVVAKLQSDTETLNIIVVYAAPSVSRRSGLWEKLSEVLESLEGPIVIGGDFNTIVRLDERSGGNGSLSLDSVQFGDWINSNCLVDMGFNGNKFTWKRGKVEANFVAKRLDRVLCCAHARLKWQDARVTHLPFLASDHAPLYVQLSPVVDRDPSRRPFRFEAMWLSHPSFREMLLASWNGGISTAEALAVLRFKLKKWNREVFGDVKKKKEDLMKEIKDIQDALELSQSDDMLRKEEDLIKAFDVVLEQKEIIWFHKSREKWVALGDRNTNYFHTSTIIRRRQNRIERLRNEEGSWISDAKDLEALAVRYYQRLYSMDDVPQVVSKLPQEGFASLTQSERLALNKPFSAVEVEIAMKSMGKYKAPGPDGYQPIFYQSCWEIVGDSVIRFALDFFRSGVLPPQTNDALVVLIPKVARPESMNQFHPISLCNALFKMITKMLVLRLKQVIGKLIGPAQSSFIPGRLSPDNIVVVQEAVHSMRRKKGRKGWMLLKLDLEKAYDHIRWDFLEDTLRAAGLEESWVQWILQCVTGPSMSVLWNGEKTEGFMYLLSRFCNKVGDFQRFRIRFVNVFKDLQRRRREAIDG